MELRSKPFRIAVAVGSAAVLAVGSTVVATSSEAAPARNQQSSAMSAAGVSSAATRAAAAARLEQCLWLQRHKITVDGVYGPQTRSAMNWRLYNPAKKIWSSACYSPI